MDNGAPYTVIRSRRELAEETLTNRSTVGQSSGPVGWARHLRFYGGRDASFPLFLLTLDVRYLGKN